MTIAEEGDERKVGESKENVEGMGEGEGERRKWSC